jgi:hypothetical protein
MKTETKILGLQEQGISYASKIELETQNLVQIFGFNPKIENARKRDPDRRGRDPEEKRDTQMLGGQPDNHIEVIFYSPPQPGPKNPGVSLWSFLVIFFRQKNSKLIPPKF